MTELESKIMNLKKFNRDNYYFLRRRVDKGNGKKTLGWILKRDDTTQTLEGLNFFNVYNKKNELKDKN